eukprot:CAMPEP_0202896176 /NCGR_PEP_ID=MMETSP1392-20130828/5219_1 /ASSEMBLY_ACC=CAM_ASM_000868 /TAXON_ID=225041 /ORGANISM="Chlamydomonas chlamydogama, Strain SAG 11-48b" /LENGTH=583 /DNA_ID=CAMNT_0049581425 /DNA_START=49 /DNA_END=1800 /DNA_ORIENTATION=+
MTESLDLDVASVLARLARGSSGTWLQAAALAVSKQPVILKMCIVKADSDEVAKECVDQCISSGMEDVEMLKQVSVNEDEIVNKLKKLMKVPPSSYSFSVRFTDSQATRERFINMSRQFVGFKVPDIKDKEASYSNMFTHTGDDHRTLKGKMIPEKSMQVIFMQLLEKLVGEKPHYKVVDTHTSKFLDARSPDITLIQIGQHLGAFSAVLLIELQRHDLDNEHRGRVLYYLEQLMHNNAGRTSAVGVLTNTEVMEVFLLTRNENGNQEHQSASYTMLDGGWAILQGLVQLDPTGLGWDPPVVTLNEIRYLAVGELGCGRDGIVYEAVPEGSGSSSGIMALKVFRLKASDDTTSFHVEKQVLGEIKDRPHPSLPQLVASSNDPQCVLLTKPVVRALEHITHTQLVTMLDVCKHLHCELKIVSRDMEPKHWGGTKAGGKLCLLDLSCAAALPGREPLPSPAGVIYNGTLIYASEDVLDSVTRGVLCTPHRQQDLVALVKTIFVLTHPLAAEDVQQLSLKLQDIKGEDQAAVKKCVQLVRSFWKQQLRADRAGGQAWLDLVKTASSDGDDVYDKLQAGLSVLIYPGR